MTHKNLTEKLPKLFRFLKKGMNEFQILSNGFLNIFYGNFEAYQPVNIKFDFILHDAFSPNVNPRLWTDTVFKKMLSWSKPNAILSTYCAASAVRGAMASAGWKVARAPGALKKREMTIASPSSKKLNQFKRVNEKHLADRYKRGDF